MESALSLKSATRMNQLMDWLKADCNLTVLHLQPMLGDASFRRYFRLQTPHASYVVMGSFRRYFRLQTPHASYVVMDAPPGENTQAFVDIAKALRKKGLIAPEILGAELSQGFLLLTDLGDVTYLKALNASNADTFYTKAIDSLCVLQGIHEVDNLTLPFFAREWMWQEWQWHKEWFVNQLLGLTLSESQEKVVDASLSLLIQEIEQQPKLFMHRDFHSANLMVLPQQQVGLLDFQDAFIGPMTYDLVSLLRDCYIDWPQERVQTWALYYWRQALELYPHLPLDQAAFLRGFDYMGIQRHLKALFTFARKHVRDKQSAYLKHIPRTLHYLTTVTAAYPELAPLHDYLQESVLPTWNRVAKI